MIKVALALLVICACSVEEAFIQEVQINQFVKPSSDFSSVSSSSQNKLTREKIQENKQSVLPLKKSDLITENRINQDSVQPQLPHQQVQEQEAYQNDPFSQRRKPREQTDQINSHHNHNENPFERKRQIDDRNIKDRRNHKPSSNQNNPNKMVYQAKRAKSTGAGSGIYIGLVILAIFFLALRICKRKPNTKLGVLKRIIKNKRQVEERQEVIQMNQTNELEMNSQPRYLNEESFEMVDNQIKYHEHEIQRIKQASLMNSANQRNVASMRQDTAYSYQNY